MNGSGRELGGPPRSGGPRADRVAAGLLAGVSLWFLALGGFAVYAETMPFGANIGGTGLVLGSVGAAGLAIARMLWAHRPEVRGLALLGCLLVVGMLVLVVVQGLGPRPVRAEAERYDDFSNLAFAALAGAGAVLPLVVAAVALAVTIRRAGKPAYVV